MCDKISDMLVKMGLRRITKENMLYYYYPMKGAACYILFAGHVMNPAILSSWPLMPRWVPVSNLALLHAHAAAALYLYGSRHLRQQPAGKKGLFSVFGSVMFNMGSVLMFAILRQATPECATFRALVGMTSAAGLLFIGKSYVDLVDRQAVLHDVD